MDKKLQTLWYKKLRDSGFEDIEKSDGSLKDEVDLRTRKKALHDQENRLTYYRMASAFLHEHPFKDDIERAIWEAHSEGLSVRRIAALTKIDRNFVYLVIKEIRAIMRKKL
jgi:hypothetical protein